MAAKQNSIDRDLVSPDQDQGHDQQDRQRVSDNVNHPPDAEFSLTLRDLPGDKWIVVFQREFGWHPRPRDSRRSLIWAFNIVQNDLFPR
jgi:hypothetical protein